MVSLGEENSRLRVALVLSQAKCKDHDSAAQAHKERADALREELEQERESNRNNVGCADMQVSDLTRELEQSKGDADNLRTISDNWKWLLEQEANHHVDTKKELEQVKSRKCACIDDIAECRIVGEILDAKNAELEQAKQDALFNGGTNRALVHELEQVKTQSEERLAKGNELYNDLRTADKIITSERTRADELKVALGEIREDYQTLFKGFHTERKALDLVCKEIYAEDGMPDFFRKLAAESKEEK